MFERLFVNGLLTFGVINFGIGSVLGSSVGYYIASRKPVPQFEICENDSGFFNQEKL